MPLEPSVPRRERRGAAPTLDLESLPPRARAAVEALLEGREVTLRSEGRDLGALTFRPSVLEGTVVATGTRPPRPVTPLRRGNRTAAGPNGVTVVATATKLSDAARRRLSDELGDGYIVLDLLKAPSTADVVLIHPVSPQLLGSLRGLFPDARIIVTEIEDEELGVSAPGPVSRLLDAGASAYLPPRPLREVAASVHAYLCGGGAPQLTAAPPAPCRSPASGRRMTSPRRSSGWARRAGRWGCRARSEAARCAEQPPSRAGAVGHAGCRLRCLPQRPKRLSRNELVTTSTDDSAIVAPAIIGLSRPKAASGIAAVL